MAKSETIKLTDLQVNTENYRFEAFGNENEAISKMIDDQEDKLYNLAEHMVNEGLNPNDRIQVVVSNHDATKYIVLEGNRRFIALKLLSNPELVGNKNDSLKKKFKNLHDTNKSKIPREVECIVYDDPSEADMWIKLKHAGESDGVGTVKWDAQQIRRFEEKVEGKSSIALQTIKLLEKSPDVPSEIKNNLKNIPITNLDRLLSDPDIRDMLGIEINNGVLQSNIEEKEVIKGLTQVAKDLLTPGFTVGKIYNKQDKIDYKNGFSKSSIPDTSKKASTPWQFNGSIPSSTAGPAPKPKPNPKHRKKLIPKTCSLKISNAKVNAIYHELQKIDTAKFTNATGVLFRVFIELSIDCYIEEHKLTNMPSSANSGSSFQQKVFQVASHLETKKLADATICKGIKIAVKDKNSVLGLDTWHAYVHNNRFSPIADNLIITWDNMQDFMEILWNNIK